MFVKRLDSIKSGTIIPKPKAKADFVVKGWGTRRGKRALIYKIPNHKNPNRPYEKGITIPEFKQAYDQLMNVGEFSSRWFSKNMRVCAKEGSCNFTTIGGIFELLGVASHTHGAYVKKS